MGFIGSHLAEKVSQSGYQVTVFDSWTLSDLKGKVDFIQGDITDFDQVRNAVRGQDGVVHLAAISKISAAFEDPLGCIRTNVLGTMNVLEGVREDSNHAWVILTSTRETASSESDRDKGKFRKIDNLYGISKLVGEICGERYAIDYKSRILTLKLSDVYGSKRDNPRKVVSKLVLRALNNLDLLIQQGEQQFDFTHWKDVTDGFLFAIKNIEQARESYYNDFAICTGKKTSLEELARMILKEAQSTSRIVYFELNVRASRRHFTSPKKAQNILGFKAKIGLPEGIKETVGISREQLQTEGSSRFGDVLG